MKKLILLCLVLSLTTQAGGMGTQTDPPLVNEELMDVLIAGGAHTMVPVGGLESTSGSLNADGSDIIVSDMSMGGAET